MSSSAGNIAFRDCQKTVSSVKALFLYTPSPPAKEASAHDPAVKHKVVRVDLTKLTIWKLSETLNYPSASY